MKVNFEFNTTLLNGEEVHVQATEFDEGDSSVGINPGVSGILVFNGNWEDGRNNITDEISDEDTDRLLEMATNIWYEIQSHEDLKEELEEDGDIEEEDKE